MKILNVTDTEFKAYGKVLEGYDTAELLKAMEHAPLPLDEVIYEPSIEELEALKIESCIWGTSNRDWIL